MTLRELLKRFDLWLRPAQVHGEHGEGNRTIDSVDALTTALNHSQSSADGGGAPVSAPPNWVPSQQDRPRY